MKSKDVYEKFTNITKELLDSVCVGDLIRINDWKKPLRVKGVSKDYFVMATKQFGKCVYSVCEKKPWKGTRHNSMVGGMFHVGTDGWVFGSPIWLDFNEDGKYDFDNPEATKAYLDSFELPEGEEEHSFISPRRAVPIETLYIKKAGIKGRRII